MTTDEARHDRQVCCTIARRWHMTGRIVKVYTQHGPILDPLEPSDPNPVAIVQFEVSNLGPYSGDRITVPLSCLTPKFTPSDSCPICRHRDKAEELGAGAARVALDSERFDEPERLALNRASYAAHHAREYFRLIEEDHTV